jgi:hypothetical protein
MSNPAVDAASQVMIARYGPRSGALPPLLARRRPGASQHPRVRS